MQILKPVVTHYLIGHLKSFVKCGSVLNTNWMYFVAFFSVVFIDTLDIDTYSNRKVEQFFFVSLTTLFYIILKIELNLINISLIFLSHQKKNINIKKNIQKTNETNKLNTSIRTAQIPKTKPQTKQTKKNRFKNIVAIQYTRIQSIPILWLSFSMSIR